MMLSGLVSVQEILAHVESDRYLSLEETAHYVGLSKRTLRSHVSNGTVPHYRPGRALRFKRSELDAWMRQWKVETSVDEALRAAQTLVDLDLKDKENDAKFK